MTTLVNVRESVLALALFFNPLGYNELFAFIMNYTNSYWITSCIFYVIAGTLFGIFLLLKFSFPLKFPIKVSSEDES